MRTQNTPWSGSIGHCPFCDKDLTPLGQFVDGRTALGWATMCVPCHKTRGFGLGVGNGQHYKFNEEDDTFYKV